jgi:hypothetical protein
MRAYKGALNSRLHSEKSGASARPCNSPLLGSRAGQGRGDVQGDLLPDGHVRCTSRTRVRDPGREENHLPVVQGASQGERSTQQERRAVALAPLLSVASKSLQQTSRLITLENLRHRGA